MNNLKPTHPGAVLREDVLPELNISKAEFARRAKISRNQLYRILDESDPIRTNTALKLGKLLGNGASLWLNMQQAYDVWQAEQNMKTELQEIVALSA